MAIPIVLVLRPRILRGNWQVPEAQLSSVELFPWPAGLFSQQTLRDRERGRPRRRGRFKSKKLSRLALLRGILKGDDDEVLILNRFRGSYSVQEQPASSVALNFLPQFEILDV